MKQTQKTNRINVNVSFVKSTRCGNF